MTWQLTPYTVPLTLATLLGIASTIFAWRQRSGPVEVWGTVVQIAFTLWALLTLLTVSSVPLELKLFWFQAFLPTIGLMVVSTLCFTLHFSGRGEWLTRPRLAAFVLFLAAVLAFTTTNDVHGLVLVEPHVERVPYALLDYRWGPGAYTYFAMVYPLTAVYCGLLFLKAVRSRNVYRRITFVIFVVSVTGVGLTVISLTGKSPFPHFMLLPFAYLGQGLLLILGTSSVTFVRRLPVDRLFSPFGSNGGSVVPLARDFIVEAVDNGIVVLDRNDRVVDINTTAKKMLGNGRPVGKHVSEVIRPEMIVNAGDLEGALDGSEPVSECREEVWIRTVDGELCYDVRVSEIGTGDDPVGHVALLHDVTRQKRREEQLEAREQELELQKGQLEYQNERLDRFASVVSHDLRNPLNVAQGYLGTMLSGRTESAGRGRAPDEVTVRVEFLEEIQRSHDRMGEIIDDALALARQGKAITETEAADLSAVAREAWENVETENATLVLENDRTVVADRGRLLTVFENLFRNSIEHGLPAEEERDGAAAIAGIEELTVRVGRLGDERCRTGRDGDRGGFYVEDDGTGIPDDSKESVLDEGYTTAADGTGFGLAIVRDVVRAHGWSIAVTDAGGGGARFEISGIDPATVDELEEL